MAIYQGMQQLSTPPPSLLQHGYCSGGEGHEEGGGCWERARGVDNVTVNIVFGLAPPASVSGLIAFFFLLLSIVVFVSFGVALTAGITLSRNVCSGSGDINSSSSNSRRWYLGGGDTYHNDQSPRWTHRPCIPILLYNYKPLLVTY